MAWIYLVESVESQRPSHLGSDPSPIVKTTDTLKQFYCPESGVVSYQRLLSGMMLERSEEIYSQPWISSMAASLARTSVLQDMVRVWLESAVGFSSKSSAWCENLPRRLSSLKTCPQLGPVEANEWSKDWPASGMTVGGRLYPLPKLAHPISVKDGSSLLPTPAASSYGTNRGGAAGRTGKVRPSLATMAKNGMWPTPRAQDGPKGGPSQRDTLPAAVSAWPTPTARDWKSGSHGTQGNSRPLSEKVGGQLNPTWVEWLMGYPTGWTVLEDWATQWFRPKPKKRLSA
jgi:hypothetical protein